MGDERERGGEGRRERRREGEEKDDNVTGTCMDVLLYFPPKGS